MSAPTIHELRLDLRARADRLVAEHQDLPAPMVLRTFSVAVQAARRAGCDLSTLSEVAESMTRTMLAGRAPSPPAVRRRETPR